MLDVQRQGKVAIIDVRERIRKGQHPRREILEFVKAAEEGTVIEVHVPHAAQPLVNGLESIGVPAILNMLAAGHYRILCVKM